MSALLYTVGGLVSSALIGTLLGYLGSVLDIGRFGPLWRWLCASLALVLAAREAGWLRFALPERKLQTEKQWFELFGPRTAALMWGLHLGLGLFTRINYGGLWLLILIAVGAADPAFGAALMAVHWLGRSLPVWQAPAVLDGEQLEAKAMADGLFRTRHLYVRTQIVGLLGSALLLGWWGATPWP